MILRVLSVSEFEANDVANDVESEGGKDGTEKVRENSTTLHSTHGNSTIPSSPTIMVVFHDIVRFFSRRSGTTRLYSFHIAVVLRDCISRDYSCGAAFIDRWE
jgi:hypothetical protein